MKERTRYLCRQCKEKVDYLSELPDPCKRCLYRTRETEPKASGSDLRHAIEIEKKDTHMKLHEAIKSGKKFKRKDNFVLCSKDQTLFTASDVLYEDWEVIEEKRELTWGEIVTTLSSHGVAPHDNIMLCVKKKLGFAE